MKYFLAISLIGLFALPLLSQEKEKPFIQMKDGAPVEQTTAEKIFRSSEANQLDPYNTALLVDVFDRSSKERVKGVEVYLFEMPEGNLISTARTETGAAVFMIRPDTPYEIRTCRNGYIRGGMSIFDCFDKDKVFCLNGVVEFDYVPPAAGPGQLVAKIAIDPIAIGQTIKLDNVYYDLDKWFLRPDSKKELNKVYDLMRQYKSLKIELSSHTDSRGSFEYNQNLSAKRAESCYKYLIGRGIDADRIIHRGYGELVLLNECADDVKCDEVKHQLNRRTEISILELEDEECVPALEK